MKLRPYQALAYDAVCAEFEQRKSTMLVLPTGAGKTVVFAQLASDWAHGRVMVLAHRDELVRQAARKLYEVTGEWPAIEMADERSNETEFGRSQFIVASVQSLHASRLSRFKDIGLVIRDEAHRSGERSKTDGRIFNYFAEQNPRCRFLGVTATPNRADRAKTLFESVCFRYGISEACDDGWLVEPRSLSVVVESLDLSAVRATKNDLNEGDLAKSLEREAPLHEMADVILRESVGLQTVVFCASVRQAEELCRVLRGYRPGCAEWICGETPKPVRREALRRFDDGDVQYIVNVGCLVEGWDSPAVGCIAMARPTRSQVLAIQMLGRGTRPLPGLIDDPLFTAEDRKLAIAASAKPNVKVLDFVDVSRQHKLITSVDARLLGGQYSEAEIAAAKQHIESQSGESVEISQAAKEARKQLIAEAEARKLAEARRREEEEKSTEAKYRIGSTSYSLHATDLFDPSDAGAMRKVDTPRGKPPTEKQIKFLKRHGVAGIEKLSRKQCSGIIVRIKNGTYRPAKNQQTARSKSGVQHRVTAQPSYSGSEPATSAQKRVLDRYQINSNVTAAEAARLIGQLNDTLKRHRQQPAMPPVTPPVIPPTATQQPEGATA